MYQCSNNTSGVQSGNAKLSETRRYLPCVHFHPPYGIIASSSGRGPLGAAASPPVFLPAAMDAIWACIAFSCVCIGNMALLKRLLILEIDSVPP
jgi:hypothetical protein